MIKINLVPAEVLLAEAKRRRVMQAGAVGVLLLLVFIAVSLGYWNKERRLDAQLRANEVELQKLKVIVEQVNELQHTAENVRHRLETVRNLLTGRFVYTVFMEDWIRAMPQGVWLLSMSTGASGNGLSVSVNANARSQESVSEWLRALEGSGGKFTGPDIGPISLIGAGGPDAAYGFSLRVGYTFTPPKELAAQ